jgi:3-dehydroquinate synthase
MRKIDVHFGAGSYPIKIGQNNSFVTDFKEFGASKYAIITDSNVKALYADDLQNCLKESGLECELISFPAGESSKTPETAITIARQLAKNNFDKNSLIIALGGGVVGDLAGFIASFYKRGIDFVQAPTTLLAQVDSAIGGKTAVNISEGKNLIGSFYQPKAVFIDVGALQTLPKKEIRNGFAEIIKYGVIQNKEIFDILENSAPTLNLYEKLVEMAVKIKAAVVEKDEKETGLRKILNYGHTIGHAIETAESYAVSHGEAISLGMVYEAKISEKLGLLDKKQMERQNSLLTAMGLPTTYKGNVELLIQIMQRDKKNKDGKIYFVLPTEIGNVKNENGNFAFPVEETIVRNALT